MEERIEFATHRSSSNNTQNRAKKRHAHNSSDTSNSSHSCHRSTVYRARKKSLSVVWLTLLLLLVASSASTCLQQSPNHAQRFFSGSVYPNANARGNNNCTCDLGRLLFVPTRPARGRFEDVCIGQKGDATAIDVVLLGDSVLYELDAARVTAVS